MHYEINPNAQNTYASSKTLTFDCYGTLIDWKTGLRNSIASAMLNQDPSSLERFYDTYLSAEVQVESGPYRSYREVLAAAAEQAANSLNIRLRDNWRDHFADSLTAWPPFPDTVAALHKLKTRFRLGILSNIDRDLFEETARLLEVPFDFIITAQDVQAYKPNHTHFQRMLNEQSARNEVIHVAQSLFHDGVPARKLGLAFVWINRYNDRLDGSANPLAVYHTLAEFADASVPPP